MAHQQTRRETERQLAHWVTICKLLLYKLDQGDTPVHITTEDIKAIESQKGTQAPEVLCRPDGQGGVNVSLTTVEKATRIMAHDHQLQHAAKSGRGS